MITQHATDRMQRLDEINCNIDARTLDTTAQKYKGMPKAYVRVKKLNKYYYTSDGSMGDTIVMIVKYGTVVTVMLSEQSQTWTDGTFHISLV